MEKIIERDFFPDLENLKERMEYIEAKESNNVGKLRALFKKYASEGNTSTLRNIENSPATFETPAEVRGSSTPASHRSHDSDDSSVGGRGEDGGRSEGGRGKVSLDDFLARHTSEDNESFEELMKENERRFRQKVRMILILIRYIVLFVYIYLFFLYIYTYTYIFSSTSNCYFLFSLMFESETIQNS